MSLDLDQPSPAVAALLPPPVWDGGKPVREIDGDQLNRSAFAKRVAEGISGRWERGESLDSIVVGLYGAWGDGKTTLLNFIEQYLRESPEVIVVRLDLWRSSDDGELLQSFFDQLADALAQAEGDGASGRVDARRRFHDLAERVKLRVGIPMAVSAQVGMGDVLRQLARKPTRSRVEAEKAWIGRRLVQSGRHVVVLMDDLDRLNEREVQGVFRLVTQSTDFSNTTYVLAFDPVVVSQALGRAYASDRMGNSFLDKVVQVPLHLPAMDRHAVRTYLLSHIGATLQRLDAAADVSEAFKRAFDEGIWPSVRNLRRAKHYINHLSFAIPLLRGEVSLEDQLLVEGMRAFYPRLYEALRDHPGVVVELTQSRPAAEFPGPAERLPAHLEAALADLLGHEQWAARRLIRRLFPMPLPGTDAQAREDWAVEQRVCSLEHFGRYFGYGVMSDDVTRTVSQEVLELAREGRETALEARLRSLFEPPRRRVLVLRLLGTVRDMTSEQARHLARTIARCADHALAQDEFVPVLLRRLAIRSMASFGAEPTVREILAETKPFSVALRWFHALTDTGSEGESAKLQSLKPDLGQMLAHRAQDTLRKQGVGVAEAFPQWFAWATLGDVQDTKAARDWLADVVPTNPALAAQVIHAVASADGGDPPRPTFGEQEYAELENLADPAILYRAIRSYATGADAELIEQFRDVHYTRRGGSRGNGDRPGSGGQR